MCAMCINGLKGDVITRTMKINQTLPGFDHRDQDNSELLEIVLNPELLASFQYYTRFR